MAPEAMTIPWAEIIAVLPVVLHLIDRGLDSLEILGESGLRDLLAKDHRDPLGTPAGEALFVTYRRYFTFQSDVNLICALHIFIILSVIVSLLEHRAHLS